MVCLASAFVSLVLIQFDRAVPLAWPIFLGIVAMAAAGTLVALPVGDRLRVMLLAAVIALAGITVYTADLFPRLRLGDSSDVIFLSLPKIALILFGVVVGRTRSGPVGVIVATLVAEVPVAIISVRDGHGYSVDVPAIGCALVMLLILTLLDVSRARGRSSEPVLSRASRDELVAEEVTRAELASSAMVHDTVLNELAVIGTLAPGPLSETVRNQIRRSLALLGSDAARSPRLQQGVLGGDVAAAVEEAREQGLEVSVAGEVAAVDALDPRVSVALGLAVLQCLSNVAAHAGTSSAELTVIATDLEVCVMVIDSGVGFVESEAHTDRLGLRHSVRARIADVGGSVQVWTSPGAGTAVSMLVPRS
jgi:signal transduction histidine kinase